MQSIGARIVTLQNAKLARCMHEFEVGCSYCCTVGMALYLLYIETATPVEWLFAHLTQKYALESAQHKHKMHCTIFREKIVEICYNRGRSFSVVLNDFKQYKIMEYTQCQWEVWEWRLQ